MAVLAAARGPGRIVAVVALAVAVTMTLEARSASPSAVRVLDAHGGSVDARGGVAVWARSRRGVSELVARVGGRVRRVEGVPGGKLGFRSLGVGLDRAGRLVATYVRCDTRGSCVGPFVVDVRRGGERPLALPVHRGCDTVKSVSAWRDRVAYILGCSSGGRSGVYVRARGARTRRLIALTLREARGAQLDLGARLVAVAADRIGVRLASTGARTCRSVLDVPKAAPGAIDFGPVQVDGGRVWWVRERLGAYGGGVTVLAGVAVDAACSATPIGAPLEVGYSLVDSFAVDAMSLYVASAGTGVIVEPFRAPNR